MYIFNELLEEPMENLRHTQRCYQNKKKETPSVQHKNKKLDCRIFPLLSILDNKIIIMHKHPTLKHNTE